MINKRTMLKKDFDKLLIAFTKIKSVNNFKYYKRIDSVIFDYIFIFKSGHSITLNGYKIGMNLVNYVSFDIFWSRDYTRQYNHYNFEEFFQEVDAPELLFYLDILRNNK